MSVNQDELGPLPKPSPWERREEIPYQFVFVAGFSILNVLLTGFVLAYAVVGLLYGPFWNDSIVLPALRHGVLEKKKEVVQVLVRVEKFKQQMGILDKYYSTSAEVAPVLILHRDGAVASRGIQPEDFRVLVRADVRAPFSMLREVVKATREAKITSVAFQVRYQDRNEVGEFGLPTNEPELEEAVSVKLRILEDQSVYWNGRLVGKPYDVDLQELGAELGKYVEQAPDARVLIVPEGEISYDRFVHVLDACAYGRVRELSVDWEYR